MGEFFLGDAMSEYLKKSRLSRGLKNVQIEDIWAKIMGKAIANYTDKIQLVKNTIFIKTTVPPLKQEVIYQKAMIIKRFNEELGEEIVKEVVVS